MTRVVVYGNCQARPLSLLLQRAAPQLDVVRAPPVHLIRQDQVSEIEDLFQSADVVVSQPIGERFGALSSDALQALPGHRDWITYPSIYFGGLFPYLRYLRQQSGAPLKGPLSDYHDSRIIESFLAGLTEPECVEVFLSQRVEDCVSHFENSVSESERRESELSVKVMDYVVDRVRSERTFHTFNHPSNDVIWHVAKQIIELIGVSRDSHAMPPRKQFLSEISAAIPRELAGGIGLQFVDADYKVKGGLIRPDKLIYDFYSLYRSVREFSVLCALNGIRV